MDDLMTHIEAKIYYDMLGQELRVGQRCYFTDSAKSSTGELCTITKIYENKAGHSRIEVTLAGGKITTKQIPERFIVLDDIYEAKPHLLL